MKTVKVKFWCNAGHTEEVVDVEIYDESSKTLEEQVEEAFLKWLDNNEEVGYEIL